MSAIKVGLAVLVILIAGINADAAVNPQDPNLVAFKGCVRNDGMKPLKAIYPWLRAHQASEPKPFKFGEVKSGLSIP